MPILAMLHDTASGPPDSAVGATLTAPLAAVCGRLVALETDRRRLPALRTRFPEGGHVEIVEADILQFDLGTLSPLAPLKCVANLPYNIATAVLDRLLARRGMFSLLVLMFQKEVARRLVAGPGDSAYGSLSLATQYRAEAELLFTVPQRAFVPPPKVESAVVRLVPRLAPLKWVANLPLQHSDGGARPAARAPRDVLAARADVPERGGAPARRRAGGRGYRLHASY